MSLIMITEAMRFIEEADAVMSMEDKEFVAKYAFRTGDKDLVKKLIEELQEKDADREKVKTKYMQLADKKPEWQENTDIISRQIEFVGSQNESVGVALYSYSYIFSKNNVNNYIFELQTIKNMIQ